MQTTNKLSLNKKRKYDALLTKGTELYTENGLHNTSVDQITKKAGVAKGTFYLYFKNKEDFIEQIALKLNIDILKESMNKADKKLNTNAITYTLEVANQLVTYYTKNPTILKLVFRNFSWSTLMKQFHKSKQVTDLYNVFRTKYVDIQIEHEQVNYILFILIQLTGSICYESIINKSPAPITIMKEVLIQTIEKILTPLEVRTI